MAAPTDPGTPSGGLWYCRTLGPGGEWTACTLVRSAAGPDGGVRELADDAAAAAVGDDALVVARYDDAREVAGLRVTRRLAPKAPPLWFAELRESTARPPAVNLLAFTGHGTAEGRLLDAAALADVEVVSSDQLAAVRWYPATGEVDQIYVAPDRRREGIGSALVLAAATLSRARGWARFWGDGQRTDLGERWRSAQPWHERAAPLTHVAPPMTPGER